MLSLRNGEKIMVRVLFTMTLLFFSFQVFSAYQQAMVVNNTSNTKPVWSSDTPVVTFYLRDYASMPYAHVLLNGEVAGSFQQRYLTIPVHSGDLLSLDGSFYGRPINIEIFNASKGVKNPEKGKSIQLNGNIISLGKVTLTQ